MPPSAKSSEGLKKDGQHRAAQQGTALYTRDPESDRGAPRKSAGRADIRFIQAMLGNMQI
jgi:hypothetical protein